MTIYRDFRDRNSDLAWPDNVIELLLGEVAKLGVRPKLVPAQNPCLIPSLSVFVVFYLKAKFYL